MDTDKIAERVERGAQLLDLKVPGWERKIDRAVFNGTFDMGDWTKCVAGTLELVQFDYLNGGRPIAAYPLTIALNGTRLVGEDEAREHGFTLSGSDEAWEHLEECWMAEVDSRLGDRSEGHDE